MIEFLLLIRENADYGNVSVQDMQADIQAHIEWVETLVASGNFREGNPLEAKGTTLKNGLVTDGPYVEMKECISGYYILLADSLEQATILVKDCPDFRTGATLELREIINTDE